jgi:predicted CoA-binding protein
VSRFLIARGYEVVPVYPRPVEVHGIPTVPDLPSAAAQRAAKTPIEVVDIFRASHRVRPHVEEAIATGAKAIWMQLGVWDPDSAELADEAGLLVVMNRCPAIDHPALVGSA